MMKKVMLLSLIAVLCAAGSVYALPDPVAHWPLDGDGTDISGNGYNAIEIGGDAAFTEGTYGDAVKLSGAGWIDVPAAAWNDYMPASQAFSICFWYRLDSNKNNVGFASSIGGDGSRQLQCHLPWASTRVYFDAGGARNNNNSAWNTAWTGTDDWALITFQYEAGSIKRVYRNLDVIAGNWTSSAVLQSGHTAFVFGNNQGHSTGCDAAMDDIRIYDVVLTEEEIQEVMDGVGLQSLGAHTPTPTGTVLSNDVPATTSVSWLSPMVDSDGIPIPDTNIISVDNYAVWWGIDEEPNFLTDTPTNQTATSYTPTTAIDYETTYYWRVDTTIQLDSNEITGDFTSVIEGSLWSFITEPSYTPVAIASFDNVLTTVELGTAPMEVVVSGNSEPIYSVAFEILTDDLEYPAGSDAVLSNDGPTALTTTLSTSVAGTYKVKVTVTDYDDANTGPATTVEAVAEVSVYADACEAAKDSSGGWTANYYDRDNDCDVDVNDLAEFAIDWLNDTSMDDQENYDFPAGYVPQAVFDTRIEAEWLDPNDPNGCSSFPINDTTGIRLNYYANAIPVAADPENVDIFNCLTHGNTTPASWLEYTIDVPTAAVGAEIDVYFSYSRGYTDAGTISFGTEADIDTYGTGTVTPTGGWGIFTGEAIGKVTFTADGTQRLRITIGTDAGHAAINFDWFSFDW